MNAPRLRALQIYEELRERICMLDYPPGEIVKERDLADEFGISRTPMRRVLQWLERDGLLVSRQGHGTVITRIDLHSLKDIYFLRMKLAEMLGASDPHQPDRDCIEAVSAVRGRCERALRKPDFREFGEINIALHRQLQSLIRNEPMRETSDRLFYLASRMWFHLLPKADWEKEINDLFQEATELERYLLIGDVESAGYVRRNHLSFAFRRLEALV